MEPTGAENVYGEKLYRICGVGQKPGLGLRAEHGRIRERLANLMVKNISASFVFLC